MGLQSTVLPNNTRLQSIDLLRGAIMVLMAIDHVRVYSGLPAGGATAIIFFTRWITHYCAPGFVFFAGLSAFLYGNKIKDKSALAKFLVSRGLILVLLELTFIRFCWTFNFDYNGFLLAGVIWMLGWCMILLAAFIRLRSLVIACTGIFIVAGQELFKYVPLAFPHSLRETAGRFWQFIYPSSDLQAPFGMSVLYVLVPWIGVMALGYAFGSIMLMESKKRNRLCLFIGITAVLVFLIAGSIIIVSGPSPDETRPFIFRLLNQRKYPASVLYLLMTLGPLIALIPFAGKTRGWLARVLVVFGRVPLFYYLLHIPLIHLSALVVNYIREGQYHQEWYQNAPFTWVPEEQRWTPGLLYLVFLVDVILLYFACRWYQKYKSGHPQKKWLKYI